MNLETQLDAVLREYFEALGREEAGRGFGDGLLGFGKKLSDAPCHAAFDGQTEALLRQAGEAELSSREIYALISKLFQADGAYAWPPCAVVQLLAAQRHASRLIPSLEAGDAAALADWYEKRYPRFQRLPAQTELLKALKTRAQGGKKK